MKLQFFGREAGFGNLHNSAYFTTNNQELVIIDCPENTYQAVKQMCLNLYRNMYILITHMHDDHKGSLGILVQYVYYMYKRLVTIIAPSSDVADDIITNFKISGIESYMYNLVTNGEVGLNRLDWYKKSILTEHAEQLSNKCFGYQLAIDGCNCVYTGDTKVLEPFLPLLKPETEFYVDTSVFGGVHLRFSDCLDKYVELSKNGVKIYLMHLDNVPYIENSIKAYPNINIVSLTEEVRSKLASFSTEELEAELKKRKG